MAGLEKTAARSPEPTLTYIVEPCPAGVQMVGPEQRKIPCYGGSLFFSLPEGRAGCQRCGWSGVPTIIGGVASTRCPECDTAPKTDLEAAEDRFWSLGQVSQRRRAKVARNQPCPCGSGLKAKRCGCEEYAA